VKALIVDDSRAMRMIIGRTLKSLGFEIVEAGNGREALDAIAASGPFAVALVDWNMPVMDGYEFVCTSRTNPANKDMLIMMVTTETEHSQVVRALLAGASEYLMKPFGPEAIAEKLALLGLKKAA
jgi:two-component system chemotaxis response regulator CheY